MQTANSTCSTCKNIPWIDDCLSIDLTNKITKKKKRETENVLLLFMQTKNK